MQDLTEYIKRAQNGDHKALTTIVTRFQDMAVDYGISISLQNLINGKTRTEVFAFPKSFSPR